MSLLDAPQIPSSAQREVRQVGDMFMRGIVPASNGVLFTVSMEDYRSVSVTLAMANSGSAFRWERSVDLVNWSPVPGMIESSAYASLGFATFTPIVGGSNPVSTFSCGCVGGFLRLVCTASAAGSWKAVATTRLLDFRPTEPQASMWNYTGPSGGILDTTLTTIRAAGSANTKQVIKTIFLLNTGTANTRVTIADTTGTPVVLFRANLVTNVPVNVNACYLAGSGGQGLTIQLASAVNVAVDVFVSGCMAI